MRARATFVAVEVVAVDVIDARVANGELDALEREVAVRLLTDAPRADRIIADGHRMFAPLVPHVPRLEARDGAEALHAAVAAASVIAKDLRDRAFAEICARYAPEFGVIRGGGYVNDATRAFLRAYATRYRCLPPEARRSWPHPYVADLVRSIGAHLEPGGIAQFLGNWEVPRGVTWRDRITAWLEGTGLDAWVVQREVQDPAEYAETWARDGGHHSGTADFNAMYAAWLDDFEARDVESIGFGVITLARPAAERATFTDLMDVSWPVESPMGPTILAGIAARTWLAEHDDDTLLDVAWRCADDVHEERHTLPGAADPSVIVVRQGGGLRRHLGLTTVTAAYLSVCDGELTARAAAAAIAGLLDADGDAVRAEIVALIREAAKDGLLLA